MLRLFITGLILILSLLRQPTAAQTLDPTFAPLTGLYAPGTVTVIGPQQADGKRLISGGFSRADKVAVDSLVRLDATGALDQSFTQKLGTTHNIELIRGATNGQYLLISRNRDVTAGGLTRTGILRLNADGSADATFNPGTGPMPNSIADVVAQPDGKLIVAGHFTSFSGHSAPGLVRLQADGSLDATFTPGTGPGLGNPAIAGGITVLSLQSDGKILVGGEFDNFGGHPSSGLARLNPDGSSDLTFTSPFATSHSITTLALQPDGRMLTGGYYPNISTSSSTDSASFVRLTTTGSLDTSFHAFTFRAGDQARQLLVQADGLLLVTGYSYASGSAYLARLNANGSLQKTFSLPDNLDYLGAYALGLQVDGSLLVGGFASDVNGLEKPLIRFTSAALLDADYSPKLQVPGTIAAVVRQADGQLLIGGDFTELNEQAVHKVARLSAAGTLDAVQAAAVGPLPADVTCLGLQADGKLLVGTLQGVRRLQTTGSPDLSFSTFTSSFSVICLDVQADGRALIGGSFSSNTSSGSYGNLVRLNTDGSLDTSFMRARNAATDSLYYTSGVLVQPDGHLLVAGLYQDAYHTGFRTHVVRYEATGDLDPTFNGSVTFTIPGSNPYYPLVYDLALQPDGKILTNGFFRAVDGQVRAGIARLTATGALDASFVPNATLADGGACLVRQPDGRVLVGGFALPSSTAITLARVLDTGAADPSFGATANPNGYVSRLLLQPDGGLLVTGSFTAIGNQPAVGIARLLNSGVLAVAAPTAVAARTEAWPIPAHTVLNVRPDASARPQTLELRDALGRTVRSQLVTVAAPDLLLAVDGLPAGMYLLCVRYAAGSVVRPVIVE